MEKITLVIPTKEHEEAAKEFVYEFKAHCSKINGMGGLYRYTDNYDGWLKKLDDERNGLNLPAGYVPASTYFAVRDEDNVIVGMINIRHIVRDHLLERGGHIGYGVRPTERKKGYATKILRLGLEKCDQLGIDRVLLTCDKYNIASAKTIQRNKGILENELPENSEGEIIQRYWIDVKDALTREI